MISFNDFIFCLVSFTALGLIIGTTIGRHRSLEQIKTLHNVLLGAQLFALIMIIFF